MSGFVVALLGSASIAAWPQKAQLTAPLHQQREVSRPKLSSSDVEGEALQVLDAAGAVLAAGTPSNKAVRTALEPVLARPGRSRDGWLRLDATLKDDGDVAACWLSLSHEWDAPALADVAAAWRISTRLGSPLAEALSAAAAGVRARRENEAAVAQAVAGAQATMTVLTLLPVLGIGLGLLLGVEVLNTYLGMNGLFTLWPGLGLLWLGRRWAARMMRAAVVPPSAGVVPGVAGVPDLPSFTATTSTSHRGDDS